MERYKEAKRETKKAVSEAKAKAFEELYRRLDTKEGERELFKLAKARDRRTKDLNQVKCIKDEDENVLVKDEEIKERWKSYFYKLFNDSSSSDIQLGQLTISREESNHMFYTRISREEAKEVLKMMKNGKVVRPYGIPIEVWKCLGEEGDRKSVV